MLTVIPVDSRVLTELENAEVAAANGRAEELSVHSLRRYRARLRLLDISERAVYAGAVE